jgi:hypothetical protein
MNTSGGKASIVFFENKCLGRLSFLSTMASFFFISCAAFGCSLLLWVRLLRWERREGLGPQTNQLCGRVLETPAGGNLNERVRTFSVQVGDQRISVDPASAIQYGLHPKKICQGENLTLIGAWCTVEPDRLYREPVRATPFVATKITKSRKLPQWPLVLFSTLCGLAMVISLKGVQLKSKYKLAEEATRCPPGAKLTKLQDGCSYASSYSILYSCTTKDGLNHGPSILFFLSTMQKWKEAHYQHGKPHGTFTEWFESGQMRLQRRYQQGVLHGPWYEWFASGKPKTIGRYNHGQQDGLWIDWNEIKDQKTIMVAEGEYLQGQREGKWRFYWLSHLFSGYKPYLDALYDGQEPWSIVWEEVEYRGGAPDGPFTLGMENEDTVVGQLGEGRWTARDPHGTLRAVGDFFRGRDPKITRF